MVEEVFRAENPRHSPYGYELDHKSLFAANKLDDDGFEVGIYHSHPKSPAEPSQTDINLAHYPHWTYLIVSLAGEPTVSARGGSPTARWRRKTSSSRTEPPLACPACGADGRGRRELLPECGTPLVAPGSAPLEEPLSEAHGRARKIDPAYTQGELVRVAGGRNQAEAELIQGMLLEEGVPSIAPPQRRASTCPTSSPPARAT